MDAEDLCKIIQCRKENIYGYVFLFCFLKWNYIHNLIGHGLIRYPNPFNNQTVIQFALKQNGKVTLEIYNIVGQLVKTLLKDIEYKSGKSITVWDGTTSDGNIVTSGIYFVRLTIKENDQALVHTNKLTLIR